MLLVVAQYPYAHLVGGSLNAQNGRATLRIAYFVRWLVGQGQISNGIGRTRGVGRCADRLWHDLFTQTKRRLESNLAPVMLWQWVQGKIRYVLLFLSLLTVCLSSSLSAKNTPTVVRLLSAPTITASVVLGVQPLVVLVSALLSVLLVTQLDEPTLILLTSGDASRRADVSSTSVCFTWESVDDLLRGCAFLLLRFFAEIREHLVITNYQSNWLFCESQLAKTHIYWYIYKQAFFFTKPTNVKSQLWFFVL